MTDKPAYEELERRVRELEQAESERKRALKTSQEREEHIRSLFEGIPVALFRTAEDGRIIEANPALAEILGVPDRETLFSVNAAEFYVNPDDLLEQRRILNAHGALYGFEFRLRRSDGSIVWVRESSRTIRTPDGEVHYEGSLEDISDRKKAEEALHDSRDLLDGTQRLAGVGGWVWDVASQTMTWTDQAYRIHGFEPGEVAPGSPDHIERSLSCYDPDDRPVIEAAFLRCAEKGLPYDLEFPFTMVDGRRRWIQTTAQPVFDGERISRVIGNIVDITERKQAEEALRESEKKYRRIYENSVVGLFQSTPEGRFLGVNPAFAKMLGYGSPEELVSSVSDIASQTYANPEDRSRYHKALETNGYVEDFELKVRCKDGSEVWLSDSSRAYFDEDGKAVRYEGIVVDITERKRAEAALWKSEEKNRVILANTPAVVYSYAVNEYGAPTLLFINDRVKAILGYAPEDFIGHMEFWANCVHPEDIQQLMAAIAGLNNNPSMETEYRFKDAAGNWHWLLDKHSVVNRSEAGFEVIGAWTDITDRKRADQQNAASLSILNATLESTADGLLVINRERMVTKCNEKFLELWRIPTELAHEGSDEKLLSHVLDQLANPEEFMSKVQALYRKPEEISLENIELADGRVFERYSQPQWLGEEIIGRVWCFRDITDRKRAEEALRESEQRYRTILESIADGYYEVDLAGNLTFFNDSVCELLGYSRDELTGMNNRQYTDEHGAGELFRTFNEAYRTGRSTKGFGWEVIRKDQSRRFVEASVTLMNDSEGKPRGFRGIVRDITERKRAEEERGQLQAQLQKAQKMESIGTLAGGIAHNFNNILMGIQGRASLMMMDKGPSQEDYEHLRGIEEYVKNAVELTKDLLGFARGGKYEVKPTDMNALIKHESRMFGLTKKEIRVQDKYEKDLWTVEVDLGQMRQALLNLYVNAGQAMPGGGTLYVQTENVTLGEEYVKPFAINPGRYVKVSVTDTGIGMDDATLEKIFDPFFSTKDTGHGSGLGLASVYGIIKHHGGFINVYSEKGTGTTFTIYLPASEKEAMEEGHIPDLRNIHYGRGTVLLVDDEDMIAEVGQQMLERLGYQVLIARSGEEALDVYGKQKEEIDLVILDMIMPGIGGGEVFDKLREMDRNVKVLLSSGYSINGQAKEIMDRGCGGFIQKPFAMEELSRKVKEVSGQ